MRRRYVVRGRVQGVGFRWFARHEALRLGLRGFARNLPDGSVEVLAEGPEDELRLFEVALGRGPRLARVDGVEASAAPGELELPRDFDTE